MRTAIYAGSFDPPTKGHGWVIEEAARLFDRVVVAVAVNPDKKPAFGLGVRQRMLSDLTANLSNVSVTSVEGKYLVRYAAEVGATHLVRGIRNAADYEYERMIRHINTDIEPAISSVYLMPPRELSEISSGAVRALVGPEGWERLAAQYVSQPVLIRLIAREHQWLWDDLEALGATGDPDSLWQELLAPYFDPSRGYHAWTHIADGLRDLKRERDRLNAPGLVGLSWLCHDIVYDVSRQDNEAASAKVCREVARRLGLSPAHAGRSGRMVTATAGHESEDPDTRVLLDVDLAVLGYPEKAFDAYEAGVRKEYSAKYTSEEFSAGRASWITSFLKAHPDRIYFGDSFEERYGTQAVRNLNRSLARLQAGA